MKGLVRGWKRVLILSDLWRELSFTAGARAQSACLGRVARKRTINNNYLVKLISYKILKSIRIFITDIFGIY